MASVLDGLDALLAKLERLQNSTPKKAAKAGVVAGLTVLSKNLRQAINSSSASPAMKRAARLAVGKRLLLKEGMPGVGKFGLGVGKQSKRKKEKAVKRSADKSQRGVGISAANIHWPTMGTDERETSEHRTGKMPAVLAGVVENAVSSSGSEVLEAIRSKITKVLAADAAH
jgi:hypothetical protein